VQQNLHTTSMDVLRRAVGRAVGVDREHNRLVARKSDHGYDFCRLPAPAPSVLRRISTYFYQHPRLSLFVTLALRCCCWWSSILVRC